LRSGTIARSYKGLSRCRFCNELNGSTEFSDGVYIWPQGLVHYVDSHAVRLPKQFVAHVVARLGELDGAAVDPDW
jgi:hypothetical protein